MCESRVSIVICTRDRPDSLKACLESLLQSNFKPYEVLVVDQSTDGKTREVVGRRVDSFARMPLRYLHMDEAGLSKARNAGLEVSRGDIVSYTDDDCLVDSDWVGALTKGFETGASCVCGLTKPADHSERHRTTLISTLTCSKRRLIRGKSNPVMIGRGNNMAFRRCDLLDLGGFNRHIGVGGKLPAGEDTEIFYRLLDSGHSILYTPDAVVWHRQPDSWSDIEAKKRAYSMSAAAILTSRMRDGDVYAGVLLTGKLIYEFIYLMCGGALSLRMRIASVGLQSGLGSISGIAYAFDQDCVVKSRDLAESKG